MFTEFLPGAKVLDKHTHTQLLNPQPSISLESEYWPCIMATKVEQLRAILLDWGMYNDTRHTDFVLQKVLDLPCGVEQGKFPKQLLNQTDLSTGSYSLDARERSQSWCAHPRFMPS